MISVTKAVTTAALVIAAMAPTGVALADNDMSVQGCAVGRFGREGGFASCDDGRPFRVKLTCRNRDGGRFIAMGPVRTSGRSTKECDPGSRLDRLEIDRNVPAT